jgi:hypothetical protein
LEQDFPRWYNGEYSVDERKSDEISRLSEDGVLVEILAYIVDTGGCTVRNLENLDAVVKESEAVIQSLLTSRIIEENGELKITEEGLNLLKTLEVCEAISEDAEHNPDVIVRR